MNAVSNLQRAFHAWDDLPPDWVQALARVQVQTCMTTASWKAAA